jgi:nucleotide-binding universal stress UspA family protein
MDTILVPTDFSDNAANAVEYGAQLALATERTLLILHVERINQPKDPFITPEEKLDITLRALKDSFPGVTCRYLVTSGTDLPEEIVQTAYRNGSDLIVMGTKGVTNLEKMLFGSNTAAVIEKARCTVLSVPYSANFRQPRKFLFATNFEHDDVAAALKIVGLAKPFNATVIIAHVLTEASREEIETNKIQLFSREIALLTDYPRITYRLSNENTVSMGLDEMIESTHADVLALSTHRRSILEKIVNPSITQKFAEHSGIPLLAFHAS